MRRHRHELLLLLHPRKGPQAFALASFDHGFDQVEGFGRIE